MRKSSRVWIACAVIVTASVIAVFWAKGRQDSRPRAVQPSATAQKRTKPALEQDRAVAGFLGHQKCAECHADIHQSHMNSPHAHTFSKTGASEVARSLHGATHFGGSSYGDYQYKLDEDGLSVALKDRFSGRAFPLNFAVGSGKHAVTFLTLLQTDKETVGVEHRMSWFRHGESVGITPGQTNAEPDHSMSYFGKVVQGDEMRGCVNCHVTTGEIVGAEVHNLTAGVHCERCHGPGVKHAAAAANGNIDAALSAIQSQWTGPEEVAMCGDCHRMPHDVPTDMLRDYAKVLVRFQPIGLVQSRCYLESDGALRCTTCHDSHNKVESRSLERQAESCRSCHSSANQTHCGAGETANCIDCHMPAIELVSNVSFHDHWIRVRPEK